MKIKKFKEITDVKEEILDEIEVNPLRLIVSDEFGRRDVEGDSHERALDRVIKLDIEFDSEANTLYRIVGRYVKVLNPRNGNEMKLGSSWGSGLSNTLSFKDEETGDKVLLSLDNDAFSFVPNK